MVPPALTDPLILVEVSPAPNVMAVAPAADALLGGRVAAVPEEVEPDDDVATPTIVGTSVGGGSGVTVGWRVPCVKPVNPPDGWVTITGP